MKTKIFNFVMLVCLFTAGCGEQVTNIDVINDDGKAVMALDYRNFDEAASTLLESLFSSGRLKKQDGSRYVIATGRIKNDTMQRIDTDQLMVKIEREITNSGLGVFTAAVGPGSDKLLQDARELRDSDEFDQSTTAAKKTLIAPELTIAGKILQRNIRVDRSKQQVEYYFQLELSEVKTGLSFWQEEVIVGKRGPQRSVAW
ncbi:MAG: penicillin-binding protein activator LpoB [Sedimentisphaerales bacterium]|nr:penicillin-binding protein activator LpoB [Sedimentisphaerales bacterium]